MKKLFVLFIVCFVFVSCNNDKELKQVKQDIINQQIEEVGFGNPVDFKVKRANNTAQNIFVVKTYWKYSYRNKSNSPIFLVYSYDDNGKIYKWVTFLQYSIIEKNYPEVKNDKDYIRHKEYYDGIIYDWYIDNKLDNSFYPRLSNQKDIMLSYKDMLEKEHSFLTKEYIDPLIDSLKQISDERAELLDTIIQNIEEREQTSYLKVELSNKIICGKIEYIKNEIDSLYQCQMTYKNDSLIEANKKTIIRLSEQIETNKRFI